MLIIQCPESKGMSMHNVVTQTGVFISIVESWDGEDSGHNTSFFALGQSRVFPPPPHRASSRKDSGHKIATFYLDRRAGPMNNLAPSSSNI